MTESFRFNGQGIAALALSLLVVNPAAGAAPGQLDRLVAAGELRVCVWPDYYGVSYRNPNTQQLSGLDVDMARAFAKDLGVKLRFVDSSFSTLIDDVTRDRCDIAMFGIGVTAARSERLAFSRPYLVSDVFAITTRSNRRIREWSDIDKPGVVSPPATYRLTSYACAVRPGDDPWFARVGQFVNAVPGDGRLLESARRHKLDAIVNPQ